MPVIDNEQDKPLVCKKFFRFMRPIYNYDTLFFSQLGKNSLRKIHDDIDDHDDRNEQSAVSLKLTSSPNGCSLASSNSNTTDG